LRAFSDLFRIKGIKPMPAQIMPTKRRIRMTAMPADISMWRRAKRET
jgi:hypothetical protein